MPALGVNVAVIRSGQILMTKREDFEVWCMPGGAVDDCESVAQAAIREVREETGLEVELTRLVGIYSRPQWRRGIHIVLFAAKPIGGALQPQPGEVIEVGYFDPDNLPKPLLYAQHSRIVDALNGIGGSVACAQNMVLPFDEGLTRQDIYSLRDQSGLPRQAFYLKHFGHLLESEDADIEVGRRPAGLKNGQSNGLT